MKAYSEDLRNKIVGALLEGTGKSEAARIFGLNVSRMHTLSPLLAFHRLAIPLTMTANHEGVKT